MNSWHKKSVWLVLAAMMIVAVTAWGRERTEPPVLPTTVEEEGQYHLLVLGRDEAAGLTDVMMLVSVDAENGRICLAQIPRDTYFRYTEKNYKKINGAMSTLGGADALCRALEKALSTEIDAYILLDLDFVEAAVDMIGGVELDVPCDMDYEDPAQGLSIHIKKGRQMLGGAEAAEFVRFRSGYLRGDIGRMDAQKLFVSAFLEAAWKMEAEELPRLAVSALGAVRTNMRIDRVIALARMLSAAKPENVTLLTLPGEEVQSAVSGAWYYVLSREGTAAVLEEHFGVTGASACIDPAHLFSNTARNDLESVYRRNIPAEYYTVSGIREGGFASPKG